MQRVTPGQPLEYYKITNEKSVSYCLPPEYFAGFNNKLFVVTSADLKTTPNPFLSELAQNNWLFKHPEGGESFNSFAADLNRSMRIRIENPDTGEIDTVYDSSNFFNHRPDIRDDLEGEKYVDYVYQHAALSLFSETHQLTLEQLKKAGSAYFQQVMYFINRTIEGALSDKNYLVMYARVKIDLVFYLDGQMYLDLYQPECSVVCPEILVDYQPLKTACPTEIAVRIPFLQDKNLFGNPVIFCNEHMLPFLFSNKSVLLEKSPASLGQEQQAALEQAIEEELRIKSDGASIIKRQPTKGKHAKAIILGVTGAVCVITLTTLLAVPGGVGFVLSALGLLAADGAVSAGVTAATVFAVAGIAGVTSAGATSTVYFTARAVIPRKLMFVMLDETRLNTHDFEHLVADPIDQVNSVSLPSSPKSSPRLFDKGKEEANDEENVKSECKPK